MRRQIPLTPGFHAEPGETKHHLHDVYTTRGLPLGGRNHVGTLSKDAVKAWREAGRALAVIAGGDGDARVIAAQTLAYSAEEDEDDR